MKKVIKGRVYDTETARLVYEVEGCLDYEIGRSTWRHEELYLKKTGEYFLYGEGGVLTRWASTVGRSGLTPGSGIVPLTYEQALEWMEGVASADEYIEAFGDPSEQDGTVVVSVRVSAAAKAALDRECARTGKGKGDIVDGLLLGLC